MEFRCKTSLMTLAVCILILDIVFSKNTIFPNKRPKTKFIGYKVCSMVYYQIVKPRIVEAESAMYRKSISKPLVEISPGALKTGPFKFQKNKLSEELKKLLKLKERNKKL